MNASAGLLLDLLFVGQVDCAWEPHYASYIVAVIAAELLLKLAVVLLQVLGNIQIAVDRDRLSQVPDTLHTATRINDPCRWLLQGLKPLGDPDLRLLLRFALPRVQIDMQRDERLQVLALHLLGDGLHWRIYGVVKIGVALAHIDPFARRLEAGLIVNRMADSFEHALFAGGMNPHTGEHSDATARAEKLD